MNPTQIEEIQKRIAEVIELTGENPKRDGLLDTPRRYSKAMEFFTSGYQADIDSIVGRALYKESVNEIVAVRDIEVYSLCEHHLIPFFGKAHIAYLPNDHIIGLSKIPRIVDAYSRRLQVQERLTTQISETLMDILKPKGVAVIVEAQHLCMMMRGVQKQNSKTVTSSMLGDFRDSPTTRKEVLHLLHG